MKHILKIDKSRCHGDKCEGRDGKKRRVCHDYIKDFSTSAKCYIYLSDDMFADINKWGRITGAVLECPADCIILESIHNGLCND